MINLAGTIENGFSERCLNDNSSQFLDGSNPGGGGFGSRGAERPLFSIEVISSHLKEMGYPEKSLFSMQKCGVPNGTKMVSMCEGCGVRLINLTYSCSLRTCPSCAQKRKRRIRNKFLPYLESLPVDRNAEHLYFLTISPDNYDSPREGQRHIRESFRKFIRNKYIAERIKAGLTPAPLSNENFSRE